MLARVWRKKHDRRNAFRVLIDYVTRAEAEREPEVESLTNCLSLDTAHAEMLAVAHRSALVRGPALHIVISWREGEQPETRQALEAGRAALDALGMPPEQHQYVIAIHRDTDNVHLHVVVNRVSLVTGRAVHPGLSHLKLDRCMRGLELAQGWQRDRGPYVVVEREGQPVVERSLVRGPQQHRMPARARDLEVFGGMESVLTYARGAPLRDALAALDAPGAMWQDVHEALARHGLELRLKGRGLAVCVKDDVGLTPVKASSVHPRLAHGRLETALGAWVEPSRIIRVLDARRRYIEREVGELPSDLGEEHAQMRAQLRVRYNIESAQARSALETAQTNLRRHHKAEHQAMLKRHREVRERIRASALPGAERKAASSVAAFTRARELELLFERQIGERAALGKPQSWREWVEMLAARGDEAAILQLCAWARRHPRGRTVQPQPRNWFASVGAQDIDPLPPAKAQVMQNWIWRVDTTTGNVDYERRGERQFTDEGYRIAFGSHDAQLDVMLAGLLLARQKFGRHIDVGGNEHFLERTAMLAALYHVDVRFGDPRLEARRQVLVNERDERERWMREKRERDWLDREPGSVGQTGDSRPQSQRVASQVPGGGADLDPEHGHTTAPER
ncbi:TraI/MobA(P) family conjugative relaxase [Paraburkholderia sp. Ac-20347]|uniref:TraI/MobA(P) family conjugative relaxase n=1 Tax=Paraburkholderia sp. Ac-20347 TaxID=2703892 RepID=UPI00197D06CC|nr:TraI/MobA(P) family conjugative relaxase [Paraburkholderia sp. Ac-20347]MBN3808154.1 relaxase/mobilization nuclease domain-containing protein [Paraburkholderia sp. Ac-20347]